jgi:hypothetical protein
VRAACAGLGAVLCAGAVGCNTTEKDKPAPFGVPANMKQVDPGLPGTPKLPGAPSGLGTQGSQGLGTLNRTPTGTGPSFGTGGPAGTFGTGAPPAGGVGAGQPGGRAGAPGTVTGAGGSTMIPSMGPGGPVTPAGGNWPSMPPPNMPTGSQPQSGHTTGSGHGSNPSPLALTDLGREPMPFGPNGQAGPVAPPTNPPGK